jgi:diguanylate cyclase
MTTSKYFESPLRSKELLKRVLTFIGMHRLSANPVNYTVCYEYLLSTQPALKQEIEKHISEKIQLTDQLMETWFETFLSDVDQASLRKSQADLIEVIAKFADSTSLAEAQVHQFDQTLRHSEQELFESSKSLDAIVSYLLDSTKIMQASMEIMKQQIQESRQEINTLQERLESALEEALSDPLTGLINRKGLSNAIENLLLSVESLNSTPSLLMLDIDHFKKINDTYGHPLGDRVIKMVGDILKKQIKGKDTAARYGGEEFCILLPETELTDAVKVAENIRQTIENTRINRASDNQEICRVTISIGVACYQPDQSISDWFERADSALYRSKNEGRNRVTSSGD